MDETDPSVGGAKAGVGTEPEYVGFWARFLAFVVDSIWVGILVSLVLAGVYGEEVMTRVAGGAAAPGGVILVQLLLPAVAIVLFWVFRNATPGKMLIGAEIVDARTLGKPGTGQLVLRYLGYYVSTFVLLLGFLWIAFDARKQGWHDKIARTVVIRRRR